MKKINRLKVQYVRALLSCFRRDARGENLQERGIRALLSLIQEKGSGVPIPIKEIYDKSGIRRAQSSSAGQWGWVRAGVVEELKGPKAYRIREEFRQAIEQVFSDN